MDRGGGGAGVCWRRPRESGASAPRGLLARGVDVQLALENVVDDLAGTGNPRRGHPRAAEPAWLRRDANQRASFPESKARGLASPFP